MFSFFSKSKVPAESERLSPAPPATAPISTQQLPPSAATPASMTMTTTATTIEDSPVARPTPITSPRAMKQLGIFFAGAGFLALSTLITRRSITRKQVAALPKLYNPSYRSPTAAKEGNPEGSLIALEALNLATLNVLSFGIMATGGLAWAFDISSLDDLRQLARRGLGPPGGRTEEEAEREIEEWMAKVLSRTKKENKDGGDGKTDG